MSLLKSERLRGAGAGHGALAALLLLALGGFVLVDPAAKDSAWASLPKPTQVRPLAALQPGMAVPNAPVAAPDARGAAKPFHFAAVDVVSRSQAEKCLAEAVYYEAATESEEGQRAVAQVVLNRVRHPAFPSSVCGVVYQGSERATGCQFTFTCDGSLARTPSRASWTRAARIAREALDGAVFGPIGNATHYHATYVLPYWASSVALIGRIGTHVFYTWKGQAGSAAAFRQAYAGVESMVVRRTQPAPAVMPDMVFDGAAMARAELDPSTVRGALTDPDNADLLNFRSAGSDAKPVDKADEAEVQRAIESAL